jgi:hypothetical protein
MSNNTRQIAKEVAQQAATSNKLNTLTNPIIMMSLLRVHIPIRIASSARWVHEPVEDALSMSKNVMPTLVDVSGGVWNQVGCVLDGCCVTYELSTTSQHPSLTRMTRDACRQGLQRSYPRKMVTR